MREKEAGIIEAPQPSLTCPFQIGDNRFKYPLRPSLYHISQGALFGTKSLKHLPKFKTENPSIDDLQPRIIAALKKTWEQINPESSNPFIAPCTSTMLFIKLYGEDGEAERAYTAMSEHAQQQLLCEVFPEWYPTNPESQRKAIVSRVPEQRLEPDAEDE